MSPSPKKSGRLRTSKSKLTVKYQPLEEGIFDIKPPEKKKEVAMPEVNTQKSSDWWRFFAMAFIIFAIFTGIGIWMNGRNLLIDNKSIAYAGYDSLKGGISSLTGQDFNRAGQRFYIARQSFESIEKNLRYLTSQANHFLKSNLYLDTAQKLIESGVSASKIGQDLSALLSDAQDIPQTFIKQNLTNAGSMVVPGTSIDPTKLTDMVKEQGKRLKSIEVETLLIQKNLTTLNAETLPKDLITSIKSAQDRIGEFLVALKEIDRNFQTSLTLLGDRVPHRYLVLLQNNHELRAAGGFIGSYILVDVNDGVITKMETNDVYQTDGQLKDIIPAPPGIDQVADRLYMRDANYSPDFPETAKQIMWFLEHSNGPSVDTVIAIDQTVAEQFLKLSGPVRLANFPFLIRADNFNDLFSFHIESKLSKSATPKQLLIDFIPVFKETLLSLEDFSKLGNTVQNLIAGRHIQAYSTDQGIQALAERLKIDGKMVAATQDVDYLSVITTAIGGNKSDAYIKTNLTHHTEVGHMGELTDNLTIQKTHTWKESDFAGWKKLIDRYGTGKLSEQTLRFIHGEGDNTDYMRVYVPKGSRLIGLEGVDIEDLLSYEELGYTVFAFTFGPVSAGQSEVVKLSYKLPFTLNTDKPMDIYKFIAQKQAGASNITLNKSFQTSDYLQVLETYPPTKTGAFTLYPQYQTALDQNIIFLSAVGVQ